MKNISNENAYINLKLGKTYKFAEYKWTICEVDNKHHTAVIQSHGVTHGAWPGFVMPQFGNGSYYADSIDGQDISSYDDKMKELYNAIKDVEDKSATYGKGLYLISKEKLDFFKCGNFCSENYCQALKAAAENSSSFGSASNFAWLGTVSDSRFAWYAYADGSIYYNYLQFEDFAVAPAFNLDLTKVEIKGDEIIKKSKFDFASMTLTTQSDSSKELTDDDRLVELCKEASQRAASDNSYVPNLVLQISKRFNWDVNERYDDVEEILSQIVSTGLQITSETVSKSDIFERMFCLLTNLNFTDFIHNYTGQSASDDTPKKMDLSSFNDAQMREIHSGLEENLDVTIYAKPEFTSDQMAEIRQGLDGKLDVTIYAKLEYTRDQMVEIRLGLERKLDVTIYAKPEYTWDQMAEIRRGLVENLDVSIYAKPEYNCNQMEEIRLGLEAGLDVSVYTKPEYDHNQMKEIRLGLVNVSGNTPKKLDL